MHTECTRTALVFSFHMQVRFLWDFEHFGGKIHENFSDVALAHHNEDGQNIIGIFKRVTYPYYVCIIYAETVYKTGKLIN